MELLRIVRTLKEERESDERKHMEESFGQAVQELKKLKGEREQLEEQVRPLLQFIWSCSGRRRKTRKHRITFL